MRVFSGLEGEGQRSYIDLFAHSNLIYFLDAYMRPWSLKGISGVWAADNFALTDLLYYDIIVTGPAEINHVSTKHLQFSSLLYHNL